MTTDDEPTQYDRGMAAFNAVYGDRVVPPPEGAMVFTDVMMRSLFAEVWTREVLSVRDRRLLIMGVIAASGAADVWKVQADAALSNGELTPDELRETLVLLAPYAGYPIVSPLVAATEGVIHAHRKAAADTDTP
jgi:4-carboxymuconolactone decarboxylase